MDSQNAVDDDVISRVSRDVQTTSPPTTEQGSNTDWTRLTEQASSSAGGQDATPPTADVIALVDVCDNDADRHSSSVDLSASSTSETAHHAAAAAASSSNKR